MKSLTDSLIKWALRICPPKDQSWVRAAAHEVAYIDGSFSKFTHASSVLGLALTLWARQRSSLVWIGRGLIGLALIALALIGLVWIVPFGTNDWSPALPLFFALYGVVGLTALMSLTVFRRASAMGVISLLGGALYFKAQTGAAQDILFALCVEGTFICLTLFIIAVFLTLLQPGDEVLA